MYEGKVGCMQELGITESFSVKRQVLVQASEAAEMILRFGKINSHFYFDFKDIYHILADL